MFNLILLILSPFLLYSGVFLFPPIIWFAYVPIIFLVYRSSFKMFFLAAIYFSFAYPWLAMSWVKQADEKLLIGAILYGAIFHFLFIVFLKIFFRIVKLPYAVIVAPFLYLGLYFSFSFNVIESYSFNIAVLHPRFLWITKMFGAPILMFLIILFNSLIVFCFTETKRKYYIITTIVLTVILLSLYGGTFISTEKGRAVKVALIQGNFAQDWEWRQKNSKDVIFSRYEELTREAMKEKPDLIIWPEYAVPENLAFNEPLFDKIKNLAQEANAYLIFGTVLHDGYVDSEGVAHFWDMAYVIDRQGKVVGRYDALKPFPFRGTITPGMNYPVIETDLGKIGITICYDEFFSSIYQRYDDLGVDFYVSLANVGPITDKYMRRFFGHFSELRAIENNKYLLRAANTGTSQVINPNGMVVAKIPPNEVGYVITEIYIKDE